MITASATFGHVESPPDARDHHLLMYRDIPPRLPPSRRPEHNYDVYDGGEVPAAGAYAAAALLQVLYWKPRTMRLRFDPARIYEQAKREDAGLGRGTSLRAICAGLVHEGAAISRVASTANRLTARPPKVGERRMPAAYARLMTSDEIKTAIVAFGGALAGLPWFDSWSQPGDAGRLPRPAGGTRGYAFVVVGYDDYQPFYKYEMEGAWLCQSNWGTKWGAKGRFWMPYTYAVPEAGFEAWCLIDER